MPTDLISQVCPLMGQSLLRLSEHPNLKHKHQVMLATVGLVMLRFLHKPRKRLSLESVPGVLNYHNALIDMSMKGILLWVGF